MWKLPIPRGCLSSSVYWHWYLLLRKATSIFNTNICGAAMILWLVYFHRMTFLQQGGIIIYNKSPNSLFLLLLFPPIGWMARKVLQTCLSVALRWAVCITSQVAWGRAYLVRAAQLAECRSLYCSLPGYHRRLPFSRLLLTPCRPRTQRLFRTVPLWSLCSTPTKIN